MLYQLTLNDLSFFPNTAFRESMFVVWFFVIKLGQSAKQPPVFRSCIVSLRSVTDDITTVYRFIAACFTRFKIIIFFLCRWILKQFIQSFTIPISFFTNLRCSLYFLECIFMSTKDKIKKKAWTLKYILGGRNGAPFRSFIKNPSNLQQYLKIHSATGGLFKIAKIVLKQIN